LQVKEYVLNMHVYERNVRLQERRLYRFDSCRGHQFCLWGEVEAGFFFRSL
jgi:hypothetical protein